MFRKDPNFASAIATLTKRQRTAFTALAIGSIFPIFFLGVVRPVFWLVAFQLACATGVAYIRWRSPALHGSLVVVVFGAIACVTAVVAGAAA